MGLLDRLLGKRDDNVSDGGKIRPSVPPSRSAQPFDLINRALQAWEAGEPERAEPLFRQGVDAYRRHEPDGLDFALGRYGAFLVDQGRHEEAARHLVEAVRLGSDIPAVWGSYVEALAHLGRHDEASAALKAAIDGGSLDFVVWHCYADLRAAADDVEGLVVTIRSMRERKVLTPEDAFEMLLKYARKASREGRSEFAESVARRVIEEARQARNRTSRWAAAGGLGEILERVGRVDEAVALWRQAFGEGSGDSVTANRLTMHLERTGDHQEASRILREALTRGLPANVEEQLRKRLARCEEKTTGARKAPDVDAFSIREGEDRFELLFQQRVKPPVKDLEMVGNVARCYGVAKGVGALVDVDLDSGAEARRVDALPDFGDTWFAPTGQGIAIKRTGRIGAGQTLLWFLADDGAVRNEARVPDATSEIAYGGGLWYVGCRDGNLYAFELDGRPRWVWQTPGAQGSQDNAYFRPCPYYVAAADAFAVIASMGNIHTVSASGRTMWHLALPDQQQTTYSFSVPIGEQPGRSDAYRVLRLNTTASPDEVKSAYRAMAKATHPDVNPDDPDAAATFRRVQAAYEAILADTGAASYGRVDVTVQITGFGPTASFLRATPQGIIVGSSQGRLHVVNPSGRITQTRALGDGFVQATLRPDGSLGAAWCDGVLFFFQGTEIVNSIDVAESPQGMEALGENVLLWRENRVELLDRRGRLLWAAEFPKKLARVASHGDTVVCAAGTLTGFRLRL